MAILLIKPKHIGDMILLTPAIRFLREQLPTEKLCLLLRGGTEAAVANNPDLADIFAVGSLGDSPQPFAGRVSESWRLLRWLRRWKFRAALDFGISDRGAICAALSGAKHRITYRPNLPGFFGKTLFYTRLVEFDAELQAGHEVEKDLRLAETFLGKRCPEPRLVFHVPEPDRGWANEFWASRTAPGTSRPRIVCHMTSRWLFKCWDEQRTAVMLDKLNQTHAASLLLSAGNNTAERERVRRIRALMSTPVQLLDPPVSFEQLGAIIQAAHLFMGIDSGPMHRAAAVGTPVVAIFGPTGPKRWGPWSRNSRVVFNGCQCQDQGKVTCSKANTMKCLASITPEQVLDAVAELFKD
ncbi:MAG: putative lipopolysaccharide heptosyltransferase III [Verrucomicrobia bacterium]|nr:putative lipopolysaccharide heptosyltransferase III [Verrucomicrobiota bacterium]